MACTSPYLPSFNKDTTSSAFAIYFSEVASSTLFPHATRVNTITTPTTINNIFFIIVKLPFFLLLGYNKTSIMLKPRSWILKPILNFPLVQKRVKFLLMNLQTYESILRVEHSEISSVQLLVKR